MLSTSAFFTSTLLGALVCTEYACALRPPLSVPLIYESDTVVKPFSLQSAVENLHPQSTYHLNTRGCAPSLNSLPVARNCSRACVDPDELFASAETLNNCFAYPALLREWGSGSLNIYDLAMATRYGMAQVPADDRMGEKVVRTFADCFRGFYDSAQGSSLSGADLSPYFYRELTTTWRASVGATFYTDQWKNASEFDPKVLANYVQSFCFDVVSTIPVNGDIGGIGMMTSYYMQAAIAIGSWVLLKFWRHGPYALRFLQTWPEKGFHGARADALPARDRYLNHLDRHTEVLVDFHKAQCFFMSAVQIGAIALMRTGRLSVGSLEEIYKNYKVIDFVSHGGCLPILHVHYQLWTLRHRSWYLLLLSTLTIGLATSTLLIAHILPPVLRFRQETFPGCGTRNPLAFCLSRRDYLTGGDEFNYSSVDPGILAVLRSSPIGFAIVYLALVFLDRSHGAQASHLRRLWSQLLTSRPMKCLRQIMPVPAGRRSTVSARWLAKLVTVRRRVSEVLVFMYFASFYSTYFHMVTWTPSQLSYEWTFGQVVALTVWLQPLLQYVYLEMHGMSGTRWHLPNGFEVVDTRDRRVRPGRTSDSETPRAVSTHGHESPPLANERSQPEMALPVWVSRGEVSADHVSVESKDQSPTLRLAICSLRRAIMGQTKPSRGGR